MYENAIRSPEHPNSEIKSLTEENTLVVLNTVQELFQTHRYQNWLFKWGAIECFLHVVENLPFYACANLLLLLASKGKSMSLSWSRFLFCIGDQCNVLKLY